MNLPNQLPVFIPDNCSVIIQIVDGIEDGHEKIKQSYQGSAYFSPTSKRIQNSEGIWVQLAGIILTADDFINEFAFSGNISINNSDFYKFLGHKALNPDGTTHHLKLEVLA